MGLYSDKSSNVTADIATGLNTVIPASNTVDSVNDILLDKLEPRLPTSGTLSILSAANVNTEVDTALQSTAVTVAGTTANSVASRVASMHGRQKLKWQWAAAYILLGSASSDGDHVVVELDAKEGFLSCVDIFCDNATAGNQADASFTLNIELNDTASTAVSLCASGLFNTYWKANRMWGATTAANAAGVADTIRFPVNLPFTNTSADSLKVFINLTKGSAGGAIFLMVNYGEVIA